MPIFLYNYALLYNYIYSQQRLAKKQVEPQQEELMQVIIFSQTDDRDDISWRINVWLRENNDVEITHVVQTSDHYGYLAISIFYKKTK